MSSSKKILFVITKPILGGAQKWTLDQLRLLAGHYRLSQVCSSEGWLTEHARSYVEEVHIIEELSSPFSLRGIMDFIRFLHQTDVDLIVSSSANAGVFSRIGSLFTRIPNIYVSHGWSAIYRGGKLTKSVFARIEQLLSWITTRILTVSESDALQAIETIGITPDKIVTIENGIFANESPIETFSLPLKIIMIARFDHPKRQDLLIEGVMGIENAELFLVGDGPDFEDLKERYESHHIHFLGAQDNAFPILRESNLFALISDHEGLPISVLEALSVGLPLLLSNIPSLRTFIQNNGMLVDNDAEAIRKGLLDLQRHDFNTMSKHSLAQFHERFDLSAIQPKYLDLYAEAMK